MTPRLRGLLLASLHLLALVVLVLHVAWAFQRSPDRRTDFSFFYLSALEIRRDGNPYATRFAEPAQHARRDRREGGYQERDQPEPFSNLNPPFQAVLTLPFTVLPYRWAVVAWDLLGLAAGIGATFLLAYTWRPVGWLRVWAPISVLLLLLYLPSISNVWLDQLGFYLLGAVAVIFWLVETRRWRGAAVVAGTLAGVKLFAGLFGAYLLATRRWRPLAVFTVAFLATICVGGALGWEAYASYIEGLARVDWHATTWNASLFGLATRWIGSSENVGVVVDLGFGYPAALAMALGLCVGYGILVARHDGSPDRTMARLGIGLTCVLMLLFSPLGWVYYFPAILPAAGALLVSCSKGIERRIATLAVAGFLVLTSVPQGMHLPEAVGVENYETWRSDLPVLALMLLAGAHAWLLHRRAPGSHRTLMGS